MQTHMLKDRSDSEFVVHVNDDGRIVNVEGPWPEETEAEFELYGELPRIKGPDLVPDHLARFAMSRGLWVCYYDDVRCQTCYCDGSGKVVRCVRHC